MSVFLLHPRGKKGIILLTTAFARMLSKENEYYG